MVLAFVFWLDFFCLFVCFSVTPVLLRRGMREGLGGHSASNQGQPTTEDVNKAAILWYHSEGNSCSFADFVSLIFLWALQSEGQVVNLHHFSKKALPSPKIGNKKVVYVSLIVHWPFPNFPPFILIQNNVLLTQLLQAWMFTICLVLLFLSCRNTHVEKWILSFCR